MHYKSVHFEPTRKKYVHASTLMVYIRLTCFAYELEFFFACESMPIASRCKHSVVFTTGWLTTMPVCVVFAWAVYPRPFSTTSYAVTGVAPTGGNGILKTNPSMSLTVVLRTAAAVEIKQLGANECDSSLCVANMPHVVLLFSPVKRCD